MMRVLRAILLAFCLSVTPAFATNYYVCVDGAGAKNGTDWANAYSNVTSVFGVLNLAGAGDAAPVVYIAKGSYTNIAYSGTVGRTIEFTFSGGWNTNTLAVDGYSVFGGNASATAFLINKTAGSHGQTYKMNASSMIATNCNVGFAFWQTAVSMDNAQVTMRLTDCKGYASGTNMWMLYNHSYGNFSGPITATNCTFVNAPVGIFNDAPANSYYLDNVTIVATNRCLLTGTKLGQPYEPIISLGRCTLTGAAVAMNYTNAQAYNGRDGVLLMASCVVSNCGKVAEVVWNGGPNWSGPGNNHQFLSVYLTNNLFANNGNGFNVTCFSQTGLTNTGGYSIYNVNNTFIGNTNYAMQATTPIVTGSRNPTMQSWNNIYDGSAVGLNCAAPNSPFTLNEHHNSFFGNIVDMSVKGVLVVPDASDKLTDPLLTDTYGLLDRSSPCYNTGTSTNAPTTDLARLLRPRGLLYDIGAYELDVFRPAMSGGRVVFSGGKMVLSSY